MSHPFPAKFPGRCDANGCDYGVGDRIAFSERYDRPLCADCWREDRDEKVPTRREPACSECFLIHAGDCW